MREFGEQALRRLESAHRRRQARESGVAALAVEGRSLGGCRAAAERSGKLQDGGIEQTALHNHLLHEAPRVMYMHIGGHGAPARLAAAVHAALALTTTPFGAPGAATPAGTFGIDTAQIGQILGYHGKVN